MNIRLRSHAMHLAVVAAFMSSVFASCIEPPLNLPAEDVIVDMPVVVTEMETVWNIDVDWQAEWYYGWDMTDIQISGDINYPEPTNYEVRRYYLGSQPGGRHTQEGYDGFTVFGTTFRRSYQFGYYDMLLWSNIDSPEGTQVLVVDDSSLDNVTATTTVTRGFTKANTKDAITGVYNQPEIFYSTFERDVYISRFKEDYDYFDEDNGVWVKRIAANLTPLVYIYLVQVVLHNNDGRITGVTGDASLTAMANGTNVNTGHTNNKPCMVYFPMRIKKNADFEGERVDIIGGKLTTFGLCDMEGINSQTKAEYAGSRTDIDNHLLFTVKFSNDTEKTLDYIVTDRCWKQCHGGVLTVHIDCRDVDPPTPGESGEGNMFVPTVEDYEHIDYEIPF